MTNPPAELGIDLMDGEFYGREPHTAYAWMPWAMLSMMYRGEFRQQDAPRVVAAMEKFDAILVILEDGDKEKLARLGFGPAQQRIGAAEIEALIEERNAAKKRRDFKRSDEIRQQLADSGIIVEDTKDGSVRWKYK